MCCWHVISRYEKYNLYKTKTMLKLLSGSNCLAYYIKRNKTCIHCNRNEDEDAIHFIMHCNYFSNIRLEMFNKINRKVCDDTVRFLSSLSPRIYCYILLGMFIDIPAEELLDLRKISMSYIHKIYSLRQDLN
jgi:hypothetical protein